MTFYAHTKNKSKPISIRLPENIVVYLREKATQSNRSLSNYLKDLILSQTKLIIDQKSVNLQEFWQKQKLEPSQIISQEDIDRLSYVS